MDTEYKKIRVPYFSRFYFYGSWLFPILGAISAFLSLYVENFANYAVLPTIVLLVASLHRISWGKNRVRFGAHFTWAVMGLALPIAVTTTMTGNWLGGFFVGVFTLVVIVVRRRFCRALTRLPKL